MTPKTLLERNVVPSLHATIGAVKILGTGELTKKLTIKDCSVSASAKVAIEKAGGTVE